MPANPPQDNPQPIDYAIDALLTLKLASSLRDQPESHQMIQINADAIACPESGIIEVASIILKPESVGYSIINIGPTSEINNWKQHAQPPIAVLELTLHDRLLMPALVNAHTHLDLTHIGVVSHDPQEGFVKWIDHIRSNRKQDDSDIRHAVRMGIRASLAGGTVAVGDIAGAPSGRITDAPAHELAASPLIGVSYLEFFGIGTTEEAVIEKINHYLINTHSQSLEALKHSGVTIGFQPHAPYTVGVPVYQQVTKIAQQHSMPLSTHLAETPEEHEFIAKGTGPQRTFLERFGVWQDSILDHIAKDNHPVEHLAGVLKQSPHLVAHVNDATDAAIGILAASNTSVAYCPRGSAYFGAHQHFGPHRYQGMLDAGVNVCLGTDSIVNLDTPNRISILDEMRFLHQRDGTDPKRLLHMGTTNGARALGIDESGFQLTVGNQPLGLIAIPIDPDQGDAWSGAMHSDEPPEWVFLQEK
ncbi:MAG: amidohydrolase family protein [Phycisphaerales bacterium]